MSPQENDDDLENFCMLLEDLILDEDYEIDWNNYKISIDKLIQVLDSNNIIQVNEPFYNFN